MSDTTSAPSWGARAITAGLLALALTALTAFGLASQARADFTTGKCAGPNIIGEGGSFAKDAHIAFNNNFKNNFCNGTPGEGTINVEYRPEGSGAGVAAMKARTAGNFPRFAGVDDPPTPAEVQQMEDGTAVAGDEGDLHIYPIAVGSVVALVNFPNNCDVTTLPAGSKTAEQNLDADANPDKVVRVRFTKAQYEKVWAQGAAGAPMVKWSEVFPALVGDTDCEIAVTRVVRFDQSGTTFALKDYLNSINGSRGWKTTFSTVAPNLTREWPGAEFGTTGQCGATAAPGKQADAVDHLTSACGKGNPELIAKLAAIDGSIGYSDLATARGAGLAITPETGDNDQYWTQVENGSGAFTEPTADEEKGFRTDGNKGSNCAKAVFTGTPSSSFGDWSQASGVNALEGWGVCTLTYALVFDDNSTVWGSSGEEQQKARTVKDYQESIVTASAQGALFGADYAKLPEGLLNIAKKAVSEIGWDKANSGGKQSTGGTTTTTTPVKTTPTPVVVSNKFSVPRTTISSKKGTATFSVKLPGAGKVDVLGTAKSKGKKVNVGHVVLTAGKAGTYSVTLKPSGAAKTLLTQKGKLKVALKFTFTPTGGSANALSSSVTLKLDEQKQA